MRYRRHAFLCLKEKLFGMQASLAKKPRVEQQLQVAQHAVLVSILLGSAMKLSADLEQTGYDVATVADTAVTRLAGT